MNITDYWPMAREYSIWNTTVAALQFWTADLEAYVLSSTIEQVYNAFFYSTSTHLLCQQSDEILFGHFVTIFNAAFESKLVLEDEGYESSSENFNIPTPLRRISKIHHVSSVKNASFDPVTPHSRGTRQSHCKPVRCRLTFRSSDDEDTLTANSPLPSSIAPLQNLVVFLQQPPPSVPYPYVITWMKKKKRIFKQFPWKMTIGLWKKFQIDIYAFMNTQYYMNCVHTHAHIWITHPHHTVIPWI